MARQKGESNQGIVVSLVFFILLSLALGVTTYMGYSGQDGYETKVKDAAAKEAAAKADRDWQKAQAMAYRAAMGRLKLKAPEAFDAAWKGLADGGLSKGAADKDEVVDVDILVKEIEAKFGYNGAGGFKKTWDSRLREEETEKKKVIDENTAKKEELATKQKTIDALDAQVKAQKADFDAKLAKANKDNADAANARDKAREDLEKKVKELTDSYNVLLATSAEKEKKLFADLKKAVDSSAEAKKLLVEASDKLLAERNKTTEATAKAIRPDWKINSISGNNPYINLGSADNVKTQLTFNIHGVGPDGRPITVPKGKLEVVNVIGPHLSMARITDVKDPNRDPVLTGDVISNPAWDPFQKRRVALAGYMDMYGNGQNDFDQLKRALERQNVQVDAFLDLKDFTVKGAISLQTEFLVLGDGPETLPISVRERDGFGKKLAAGIDEMQAAAKKNGVPVMGLRKFLDTIGYKVPRPVDAGR